MTSKWQEYLRRQWLLGRGRRVQKRHDGTKPKDKK